jgi:carboxymethylenebutenolidase
MNLKVHTPDGTADARLHLPQAPQAADGPWPGVVYMTDIFGVREETHEAARRLAARGFAVLVPNTFYRSGTYPLFEQPVDFGSQKTLKRFQEISMALNPEAQMRDAGAYIDALLAQPGVRPGKVGVVGHCFTGSLALRIAAARPDQVAAVASFHAGRLVTSDPASPHLLLPRIKARLYFGHAENDGSMPAEAIAKLEDALRAWGGRFESEIYLGARHGWAVSDRPDYDPAQAERALEKLVALFKEAL